MNPVLPFTLTTTDKAIAQVDDIADWLENLDPELANRFTEIVERELAALCQDIAERFAMGFGIPQPNEEATRVFARPTFEHLFTTQKKRTRRSNSGLYRVYYTLSDADGDGEADTLQVLSVLHAAARPVGEDLELP